MKNFKRYYFFVVLIAMIFLVSYSARGSDEIPSKINYQGYIKSNGSPYTGTGYFKFSIIDSPTSPSTNYWTNDGSSPSAGSAPTSAVSTTVTDGVFNIILGNTSLTNMTTIGANIFADNQSTYLRVWFSEDGSSFTLLTSGREFVSVPYSYSVVLASGSGLDYNSSGGLQIASEGVSSSMLADSAITSAKISDGTITNSDINSSASISASKISGTAATLTGNQSFDSGTLYIDSSNNYVGIGTASPSYPLHLYKDYGTKTDSGIDYGLYAYTTAGTITESGNYSLMNYLCSAITGSSTYYIVAGATNYGYSSSSQSSNQDALMGSYNLSLMAGSGNVDYAYGTYSQARTTAGSIDNAYAYYGIVNGDSTITNGYGLYYDGSDPDITTSWGAYITGEDNNYFSGNLGIGTEPTYILHAIGTAGRAVIADTASDSTGKNIRFGTGHYTNSEEPFFCFNGATASSYNIAFVGGGSSYGNAATEIRFYTASNTTTTTGTQQMTIDSNGEVGIGASSPDRSLHVEIDDATNSDVTYVERLTHTTSGTAAAGIAAGIEFELEDDGGGMGVMAAIEGIETSASAGSEEGELAFLTADIGDDNLAERVRIDKDGKVGIGTTAIPHGGVGCAMLALDGANASLTAGPHIQCTTASDNYPLFQLYNNQHDGVFLYFDSYYDENVSKSSDAGSNYAIRKYSDKLYFECDSGVAQGSTISWNLGISMNADGNVGIGADPHATYQLDVGGDINTTGDVRKSGTAYTNPDYVFEDDYNMLSLQELKTFVKKNKHLPGMPSTQEVKDAGVKIFEQNRLTLEKLEEAYLYILELEERIAKLEEKVK